MTNLSEIQITILYSFGALALIFIVTALIIKLSVRSKKDNCSKCTKGKVVRYSMTSYGDSGIHLPVVEYEVDGEKYRKTGPTYSIHSSYVSSPFIKESTCEYTTDIYAQVFKIKVRRNSIASVITNPIAELFPIGTEIDVYYDPMKPKRAYVLRQQEFSFVTKLFLILGVAFAAIAVIAVVLV